MRYGDDFVNVENPQFDSYFAVGMFSGSKVVDANNLILPDVVTGYCYYSMFSDCTQLTGAPKLNAVTLTGYCYQYMFQRCTALREAPELPASRLAVSCYDDMFSGCSSLDTIKCNADSFGSGTSSWVYGVASTGTFYKSDNLEATYGASAIPEGWTVKKFNTVTYTLTWKNTGNNIVHTDTLAEGDPIVEFQPQNPEQSGYRYIWNEHPHTMPASDLTIRGYEEYIYKLTWYISDSDVGGEYKVEYLAEGATITEPETSPVREHYVFSWESNHRTVMPASEYRINGYYLGNPHTITWNKYDENNNLIGTQTNDIRYNDFITAPNVSNKTGYRFVWEEYPQRMPDTDLVVNGRYVVRTYTLTWNVDGSVFKTETLNYNAPVTAPVVPAREGYTFSWTSTVPATMPDGNTVIYGTYTVNSYELSWYISGSLFKKETLQYGAAITEPSVPDRSGYTFTWVTHPSTMPAEDLRINGAYYKGRKRVRYIIDNEIVAEGYEDEVQEPEVSDEYFSGWDFEYDQPQNVISYTAAINDPATLADDIISGVFRAVDEQLVRVYIRIPDATNLPQISPRHEEDAEIYFTANPVTITTEVEDSFQTIIMKSCQINLYVKKYLGDKLFTPYSRDIIVNVWKGGKCLFAGFLEPQVYNQDYNHTYDQLTLNCTDALATLQYYPYKHITTREEYTEFVNHADKRTFLEILANVFKPIPHMNLCSARNNIVYYDGSVRTSKTANEKSIWTDVSIYELLFAGDDFDDLMHDDEILEEILKYFDLKIIQVGFCFFIYSLESIKNRRTIDWYPLITDDSYVIVEDQMMMVNKAPRQRLSPLGGGTDIPGMPLTTYTGEEVHYQDGRYVQYIYAVLPNGDSANTGEYVLADMSHLDYLYDKASNYYVLEQSPSGDYNIDELRHAPNQCFDGTTFKYDYFIVVENEFLNTSEE